jgi:hypothetical protein
MTDRSLEDKLREAGDPVTLTRNSQIGPCRPSAHNWVQYHAETGDCDVELARDERTAVKSGRPAEALPLPGPGPTALEVLGKAAETALPELKFFNMGEISIAGAIRSSTSTCPCRTTRRGRTTRCCSTARSSGCRRSRATATTSARCSRFRSSRSTCRPAPRSRCVGRGGRRVGQAGGRAPRPGRVPRDREPVPVLRGRARVVRRPQPAHARDGRVRSPGGGAAPWRASRAGLGRAQANAFARTTTAFGGR